MVSAVASPTDVRPARTFARVPFDVAAYRRHVSSHGCFICCIADGDPVSRAAHQIVYEDASSLVFLNRFPTLYGHTLVCPREHREHATGDFTEDEYVRLQWQKQSADVSSPSVFTSSRWA